MKLVGHVPGNGGFWKVQLDVRDLGGHLDFILAGLGLVRFPIEFVMLLLGLLQLVLYRLGFQVKLGFSSW